jgi:hypothetical protein
MPMYFLPPVTVRRLLPGGVRRGMCLESLHRQTDEAEGVSDRTFAEKCWTHNLPQLLGLAGLKADLDTATRADPSLADNWDTVKEWNESSRYARKTKADVEDLYEAITDRKHGVLSWLKQRW